jgi:hypothetical protein
MGSLPSGWRVYPGREPERELRPPKGRSQKTPRRYGRATACRRVYPWLRLGTLTALGAFAFSFGVMSLSPVTQRGFSPWEFIESEPSVVARSQRTLSPSLMQRHVAAARNCDAARAVGLAPALRGQPGYYPQHDRDNDGIACEPWPRR